MSQIVANRSKQILLAVLTLLTMARTSLAPPPADKKAVEYYLRADTTTKIMPDGQTVVMWGFALDSAFGAEDDVVTVPGPLLTVPNDKKNLIINLDNNLPVPVSIVIPSQINTTMVPVKFTDDKGRQRIRSFTHETEPNNIEPVVYEWKNFRPGTYLYHSGSHPAVQVQMGLYGCLKKDVEKVKGQNVPNVAYKQGNNLVTYDADVVLCFSEIDPALHNAVATGNYGLGKAMTSTINYKPKYFLINGQPYSSGLPPLPAGSPNQQVLIRFVNAGLETHVPVLQGLYMNVVAEDGHKYRYDREQYSLILPAHKTKDAIITPTAVGTYPVYDRRLRMTNAGASPGGMLTYLSVKGWTFGSFDGLSNVKLTVNDSNGIPVTFSLTGGGYGEVTDGADFDEVVLYDTTEKSVLGIKTKGIGSETSVGDIIVNSPLKGILAETTDLRGNISVDGSLSMLALDDVADGHTITIGPSSNPKAGVLMKFDQVSDLNIDSDIPIKTLTATEWISGSLSAPWVRSLRTKGRRANPRYGISALAGDFGADVTLTSANSKGVSLNRAKIGGNLSGEWTLNSVKSVSVAGSISGAQIFLAQSPDPKLLALGRMSVKGWIDDCDILSEGSIGTITAGGAKYSCIFAGITGSADSEGLGGVPDGVQDLPSSIGQFIPNALIKSVSIKGIKGKKKDYIEGKDYCFINSNIAAAEIGKAYVVYPKTQNDDTPFGLAADFIKKVTVKDANGTVSYSNLYDPNDSVKNIDIEIRLFQ